MEELDCASVLEVMANEVGFFDELDGKLLDTASNELGGNSLLDAVSSKVDVFKFIGFEEVEFSELKVCFRLNDGFDEFAGANEDAGDSETDGTNEIAAANERGGTSETEIANERVGIQELGSDKLGGSDEIGRAHV